MDIPTPCSSITPFSGYLAILDGTAPHERYPGPENRFLGRFKGYRFDPSIPYIDPTISQRREGMPAAVKWISRRHVARLRPSLDIWRYSTVPLSKNDIPMPCPGTRSKTPFEDPGQSVGSRTAISRYLNGLRHAGGDTLDIPTGLKPGMPISGPLMIIACVQRRHARYLPDPTKVRQSPRGVFRRRRVRNPDLFFPSSSRSPWHLYLRTALGSRDSWDPGTPWTVRLPTTSRRQRLKPESVINEHRLYPETRNLDASRTRSVPYR